MWLLLGNRTCQLGRASKKRPSQGLKSCQTSQPGTRWPCLPGSTSPEGRRSGPKTPRRRLPRPRTRWGSMPRLGRRSLPGTSRQRSDPPGSRSRKDTGSWWRLCSGFPQDITELRPSPQGRTCWPDMLAARTESGTRSLPGKAPRWKGHRRRSSPTDRWRTRSRPMPTPAGRRCIRRSGTSSEGQLPHAQQGKQTGRCWMQTRASRRGTRNRSRRACSFQRQPSPGRRGRCPAHTSTGSPRLHRREAGRNLWCGSSRTAADPHVEESSRWLVMLSASGGGRRSRSRRSWQGC